MDQDNIPTASQEQFKEKDILENTMSKDSDSEYPDHSNKSLKEILQIFQEMIERGDQQELYKHAEGIKAAFYKALKREKIAAGFIEPSENNVVNEDDQTESNISLNPFAEVERGFKELFNRYKTLRSDFLQTIEKQKEENLAKKLEIIEELKELLEKQEDLHHTFPAFRELQNRWKSIGPVPQSNSKNVWETYQYLVEKFYDFVKINNELRDLDLKKNLEMKVELCEKAEALSEEPNAVLAFKKLQKLHEEWREIGPVSKEMREEIWDRFKKATAVINKNQQQFFENQKDIQKQNLELKKALCERVEAIVAMEGEKDWNALTKEIENIQKEWKGIGFASKKDNQKIYERFRSACDQFYNAKREHYSNFKSVMQENYEKKIALCEQAEALKDSTDWKRTTDQLISLQKKWKEIGPVARKQSDVVWKRFRAACDEFFENKSKYYNSVDDSFEQNLAKKLELIKEINDYKLDTKELENREALKDFQARWTEIGFVPFKDKERIQAAYRHALEQKFGDIRNLDQENKLSRYKKHIKEVQTFSKGGGLRTERERLVQKYRQMEQDIAVLENNIGFFTKSKNADSLLLEIDKKISAAKYELAQLEEKIKLIDNQKEQQ